LFSENDESSRTYGFFHGNIIEISNGETQISRISLDFSWKRVDCLRNN
jgi:hypothetical protein